MSRRIRFLIASVVVAIPVVAVAMSAGGPAPSSTSATMNARTTPTIVELSWAGHREGSVAHAFGFTSLPASFFVFLTCLIAAYLVLIELAKARFYSSANQHDRCQLARSVTSASRPTVVAEIGVAVQNRSPWMSEERALPAPALSGIGG